MSGHPRPFPDVVDPRSEEQRRADEAALRGLAKSGSTAQAIARPTFQRVSTIVEQLMTRRAPAGDSLSPIQVDGGVPFETYPTNRGRSTLVVANESVRRRSSAAAPQPPGQVDQRPSLGPGLPGQGSGAGARTDLELENASPELAARLRRVSGPVVTDRPPSPPPPGDNGLPGFPAPPPEQAPVMVPVLHMAGRASPTQVAPAGGVPGGVIIKAPGGASPTSVTDAVPRRLGKTRSIIVAVIDTGISAEVRDDGWLVDLDRAPHRLDRLDAFPVATPPDDPGDGYLDLGAGHGTFVAGIVRQVDPLAQIKIYRAMDSDGFGSEFTVAAAMIQAARDGAHVINLSLGTESVDGQPPVVFETALDVIDQITAGRDRPVIVAAAGNSGDDVPVWPAASQRVIAVAGLTPDGAGADWSSRGEWVDVSTIGQGIVSTYVKGEEDPAYIDSPDSHPANAWAMWTGTSFAAPQIAAAISRTCREANLSPQAAADRLISQGTVVDAAFGPSLELLPGT